MEMNRISDRIIWKRLQLNGEIANILSVYVPQVGCIEQGKDEFWELLDEAIGKPYMMKGYGLVEIKWTCR